MAVSKSRKPRLALVGSDSLKGKEILSVLNAGKLPLSSFEFYDADVEQEFSKLGPQRLRGRPGPVRGRLSRGKDEVRRPSYPENEELVSWFKA